jgi:hypothetical protein
LAAAPSPTCSAASTVGSARYAASASLAAVHGLLSAKRPYGDAAPVYNARACARKVARRFSRAAATAGVEATDVALLLLMLQVTSMS